MLAQFIRELAKSEFSPTGSVRIFVNNSYLETDGFQVTIDGIISEFSNFSVVLTTSDESNLGNINLKISKTYCPKDLFLRGFTACLARTGLQLDNQP